MQGKKTVFAVTYHDSHHAATWNPYKLLYEHWQSRCSNFQLEWAAHPFIRRFSWLMTTEDHAIRDEAVARCCQAGETDDFGFAFCESAGQNVVFLCAP